MDYEANFGGWSSVLPPNIMDKALELQGKARRERAAGRTIYPADEAVFRALLLTPPGKAKVLILGQDPYHEPGQANGLCFSVSEGVTFPPSLRNIFKELNTDIGIEKPETGDLTRWAEQGVLLLNYTLTVEQGKANSHSKWGWETLTTAVVRAFLEQPQPKVCLAWGKFAIDAVKVCGAERRPNCMCLYSTHPSPLSARRSAGNIPAFMGSKPFSQANAYLLGNGASQISW